MLPLPPLEKLSVWKPQQQQQLRGVSGLHELLRRGREVCLQEECCSLPTPQREFGAYFKTSVDGASKHRDRENNSALLRKEYGPKIGRGTRECVLRTQEMDYGMRPHSKSCWNKKFKQQICR